MVSSCSGGQVTYKSRGVTYFHYWQGSIYRKIHLPPGEKEKISAVVIWGKKKGKVKIKKGENVKEKEKRERKRKKGERNEKRGS